MSATSCEHAPSPRSSGGDFQCTEDELFESFMEIINSQSTECSTSNFSESTSSHDHEVDEDVNGNENYVSSDNTDKTKSQTVNSSCNENELNLNEVHNEPVLQNTTAGAQSNESLNKACRNISVDPNDAKETENNVSLSQNEHELNQKEDNFEEKKDSSQNQDCLSETSKYLNQDTDSSLIGRKNEALSETTGDLCEGGLDENLNQSEDEKSSVEIISDAAIKNELQEGLTDEDKLQNIEHDIEKGIRMANQVCNEIQEILTKRMSCSSDEVLSDKVLDSPKNGKANIAQDELGNAANQQSDDVVVPKEDTSSDQEGSKCDDHMSSFLKVSQGDDSSSTSSEKIVIEREKSTSDSLDSSEDSLSGDMKSNGELPSDGNINWDILNTAFGNPDTDEEDREIYESQGSYGGFGLVLDDESKDKLSDDESKDKLSDDESRKRSISLSSTISEYEFQEQYKNRHSTESLERKKDGVLCSGYLLKLGGTGITPKNWRKRWCVLRHDRCLYYYKRPKENVPCGIVVLTNYIVSRSSEFHKKNCLKISKGGGRTYYFCAESSEEMLRWMDALRKAADVIDEGTNFEIRREIIHNVAIPALSIKKPDCHGFLTKQGGTRRNSWKRRYCVLKNGCLYYYREMADTTALGVAKLHGYKLEESTFSGKRSGFRAVPPSSEMRTFSFVPDNEFDKKRWIPCLEQSIKSSSS